MNKSLDFDPCGIEVSARTLVVRRRRPVVEHLWGS